jgi:hypothetical protein
VAVGLALALAIGVALRSTRLELGYELVKDLFPLVIGILAVLVADWLQQRAIFVQSLRSLWSHVIEAKVELIAYTHDPERTSAKYISVFKVLSTAIDEMRGVYRNVGEGRREVGLYPYEPLHDMRKALVSLGPNPDPQAAEKAREKIKQGWDSLRFEFLQEFNPPEPTNPITEQDTRDPRRG